MKRLAVAALFVGACLYLHFATLLMYYPDTKGYRALSLLAVGDPGFWTGIRPPGFPLFLKLSPDNQRITLLQLLLYVGSSLALASAAAGWMRRPRAKLAAFAAVLLFAFLPQQFLWCRSISSESLTFSLLFLLLALARPPRGQMWQIVAGVAWFVLAALFIFTRDANGYLLLFLCAAALGAGLVRRHARTVYQSLAALSFTLVLTLICAHQASQGARWKWPFVNLLAQRVLARPDRLAFFTERGMPVNPQVMCLAQRWGWDCHDDLSGFGTWLDGDIKGIYERYLLSHPLETLAAPFRDFEKIGMVHDGPRGMFYYFHKPPGWYEWFGHIALEWHLSLALLVIAFFAGAWRLHPRRALLPSLVLLAAVPPMLFFVWHADAAETMRHAIVPAMLLRLGLVLGILIAYDWMSFAWRAKTHAENTSL